VETISSNTFLVNYFKENVKLGKHVVVVSPNPDCVKKAIKFRKELQQVMHFDKIEHAAFIHSDSVLNVYKGGNITANNSELLGDVAGISVNRSIYNDVNKISIIRYILGSRG